MKISQQLIQKFTDDDLNKYILRMTKDLHSGELNDLQFGDPEVIPSKHIEYKDKNDNFTIDVNMYVQRDSWNFKGTIHSKKLNQSFHLDRHIYEDFDQFMEALYRKLQEVKSKAPTEKLNG